MEDYKNIGEDRKDDEINSDDGEEEKYLKILNKRDEFNVKFLNKEIKIKIKKRTLNKIMMLSSNEPEEQVLFSLYKTVPKRFKDNIKLKSKNKDNKINETIINENTKDSDIKVNKLSNDPLSASINNNQTQNLLIQTNDVINVPNNNIDTNTDADELSFGKKEVNIENVVLVGLPPEALKTKWFYLLLAIVGLGYVIIFLVGIFNKDIGLNINIFQLFLFGMLIFFTGSFGFVKINKRIYDNIALFILTFITIFAGIVASILVKINETTERYFPICLIFGIICSAFSLICIFWMNKLRKNILINKSKKFERLM